MMKIKRMISLNEEHIAWLKSQESFNLSGFVREQLNKVIDREREEQEEE